LLNKYPLVPVTSRTITDLQAFQSRLSKIARDGYVAERGEAVEGIIGVAAPIRDYSCNVIAAIGVAIMEAQHDEISVARTVEAVKFAAKNISAELGYREAHQS
jgi:IclR family KDG regulon transcriptional repressor